MKIGQKIGTRRRYLLTIEDESRLEGVGRVRFTRLQAAAVLLGISLIIGVLTVLIVVFTPLRHLLPGYMEEASRDNTIEYIMRLDSLQQAYNRNQAYLSNIATIFNTDRTPSDSTRLVANPNPMTPDSLLATSEQEKKFVRMMEEREKYNISILAPLAADGMVFQPVSDEAVISEDTRSASTARVIVAAGRPVCAIADGRVLDTYYSRRDGGYCVLIQHKRGFVSRLSRIGQPLVEPGDNLTAGQIVALPARGNGRDNTSVTLEMWRNGTVLIPATVLSRPAPSESEEETGRGRL